MRLFKNCCVRFVVLAFALSCSTAGCDAVSQETEEVSTNDAMGSGDADISRRGADGVDGAQLYGGLCSTCHGSDGASGTVGVPISALSYETIVDAILNGRPGMPSFPNLSDEEVEAIAQHVENAL